MTSKRKIHSASFKAKVALAAIKGDKTSNQLTSEFGVTSGQISTWKKILTESSVSLFEGSTNSKTKDSEALQAPLYEEIGRLKMELTWLKKKADLFN